MNAGADKPVRIRRASVSVASADDGLRELSRMMDELQREGTARWAVEANAPDERNLLLEIVDEANDDFATPTVDFYSETE